MSVISTQGFTFRLMAGDPATQLDLFQDEDYVLSNNVTGLFDIGTLPSDFTRQITLPGTKVNNAFFQHCYDISIDNPFIFATNQKVPAYLEFDSVYLSAGYLQLNKVNVKANKYIESYEVTIFGALSSFGRDINRLFLTDLTNLAEYNHTASYDNIQLSWEGNLFNGDIVYPFCDYGTGWQYTTGDDFFGLDDNYSSLSVQDFKPAIRVKAVWDKIFEYTGYTYSSSFWQQEWLDDVYMVCNNALKYPEFANVNLETYGVVKFGAYSGSGQTDFSISDNTWTTLPWYNILEDKGGFMNTNGSYIVEKPTNLTSILNLNINVSSSNGNLPGQFSYRLLEADTAATASEGTIVSFNSYWKRYAQSRNSTQGINENFELNGALPFVQVPTGSWYLQLKINKYYTGTAAATIKVDPDSTTKSFLNITKVNQAADGRVMDIQNNMPYGTTGIKLVDFITGLQKKFNLVIYPNKNKPNEFIVETFNNWYNKGEVKDFNKYINLDNNIEVIPANNLAVNKLNFGDTLDQDYISQQFAKGANREFGKLYYTDTTNYYSQGELNVKTTFASSPLIKIAGTGLSGSVAGASGNQYQPWARGAGQTSTFFACNTSTYNTNLLYSFNYSLYLGSELFTDVNLSIPFNGQDKFYRVSDLNDKSRTYVIRINTSGQVSYGPVICGSRQ